MSQKTRNRCADCGAPTSSFLCDRCAQICDNLTLRGEYWFRRVRPVKRLRSMSSKPLAKSTADVR